MTDMHDPFASGGLFGLARRLRRNAARRHAERATIATLQSLDDYQLRDIGVRRGDVEHLVRGARDL